MDFYNIQYKLSSVEWVSSTNVLNITIMGFDNQTTIFGLMPATVYDVRIRTLNVNGESEWSLEANFSTLHQGACLGREGARKMIDLFMQL